MSAQTEFGKFTTFTVEFMQLLKNFTEKLNCFCVGFTTIILLHFTSPFTINNDWC